MDSAHNISLTVEYEPGDRVHIIDAIDVEGTVTELAWSSSKTNIVYTVDYFTDGDAKSAGFYGFQLKGPLIPLRLPPMVTARMPDNG